MKLTEKQIADLKVMALDNVKNANIAIALGISVEEVHAARSQLGITIDKAAEIVTQPCGCCGSPAHADDEHVYIMPDGSTESCLCDRCVLTVEYLNSFNAVDTSEEENEVQNS